MGDTTLQSVIGRPFADRPGPRKMAPMLKQGDTFPDMKLESREGDVALAERWRNGPLIVAFMRHFG